jgi:conjugative relaxase-like TrwC/TraI family protein
MMTLHKLEAGSGYTYLTRQVAVDDAIGVGREALGEYYSERGESPGAWLGHGLAGLEDGPEIGDRVHERQMVALFGQGRHPNAEAIEASALAHGLSADEAAKLTRLGRPSSTASGTSEFGRVLAARLAQHNRDRGARSRAAVDEATKAQLRTELGREWFVRDHGREPHDARELSDFITVAARPGSQSVAGYDLTFSPVKSVSALWALADPAVAREIVAAHEAAVRDVIDWLEREACFTRTGRDGVQQVDTRGLLAVAFTHRDSRAGDPDLHTHVAISNKVQALDGRWLALDGRPLYRASVSASERYNTRLEAQLTARLGVRFADRAGTDGKRPVREIVGVDPALLTAWSKRRMSIGSREKELAEAFVRHYGREPDFAERTSLYAQATLETRQRKHEPRSEKEQRAAWSAEASRVLGGDAKVAVMLASVGAGVLPVQAEAPALDDAWIRRIAGVVIETVSSQYATWRPGIVRAEIERCARYGTVPLAEIDAVVEATLELALSPEHSIKLGGDDGIVEPSALRRLDGASVFTVSGAQLYTSESVLAAEARILHAASGLGGRVVDPTEVELALLEATSGGITLNDGQVALVRSLATSGSSVQLALAPAGSGKTTSLGVLSRAWANDGGQVIGLAPTAKAAAELRRSIKTTTDTITKLLHTLETRAGPAWVDSVGPTTLLIVDEAGNAGTRDLDRLISFAIERGATVRLIGDTHQLSSAQSGGVLSDIAETHGAATLDALVRFADPIEADASLALRVGHPIALGYYLDHDRIHAGSNGADSAFEAWRADRAAGLDALLLGPTNAIVRDLNERARAEFDRAAGPEVVLHDGTRAGAGDTIVTRRNDRRLPITSSDWVKNGDRWTVNAIADDGGLRVTHTETHRTIALPADYVARYVELGYATTIHLAQGSTADTCHTVLTGSESRELLYVAMSRGRLGNHVYVETPEVEDLPPTAPELTQPPTNVEILERILATEGGARSATTQHRLDADPVRRFRDAVSRYVEAIESVPESAGDVGPLPWLPAAPVTSEPLWSDYLDRRSQLVRDLAAEVGTSQLPEGRWASQLKVIAPATAEHVSLWRAAQGVPIQDIRPLGPPVDHDYQQHLQRQISEKVGRLSDPSDRWRPIAEKVRPGLTDDPHWPALARRFTEVDAAGYDVQAMLPDLINRRPLAEIRGGRELYYRLAAQTKTPPETTTEGPRLPTAPTVPSVRPPVPRGVPR